MGHKTLNCEILSTLLHDKQLTLLLHRKRFVDICDGVDVHPGLLVMKDIALAKSKEFKHLTGERAVTKVQNFGRDKDLFHYCSLPEVCFH